LDAVAQLQLDVVRGQRHPLDVALGKLPIIGQGADAAAEAIAERRHD
jgi:hypothetical protein